MLNVVNMPQEGTKVHDLPANHWFIWNGDIWFQANGAYSWVNVTKGEVWNGDSRYDDGGSMPNPDSVVKPVVANVTLDYRVDDSNEEVKDHE